MYVFIIQSAARPDDDDSPRAHTVISEFNLCIEVGFDLVYSMFHFMLSLCSLSLPLSVSLPLSLRNSNSIQFNSTLLVHPRTLASTVCCVSYPPPRSVITNDATATTVTFWLPKMFILLLLYMVLHVVTDANYLRDELQHVMNHHGWNIDEEWNQYEIMFITMNKNNIKKRKETVKRTIILKVLSIIQIECAVKV